MNDTHSITNRGDAAPTRSKADLAEVLELLLEKGIVVNADVVVTVGETELLGVHLRAAIASFETAAKYGLEFPGGTDMERVRQAAGVEPLEDRPDDQVRLNELETTPGRAGRSDEDASEGSMDPAAEETDEEAAGESDEQTAPATASEDRDRDEG